MKQTITKSDFIDQFRVMDRLENFSYEARGILFDHIEESEESSGTETELDIIAICCEFSEDTPEDIAENCDIDISDCEDEESIKKSVLSYLENETTIIGETAGKIIYVTF